MSSICKLFYTIPRVPTCVCHSKKILKKWKTKTSKTRTPNLLKNAGAHNTLRLSVVIQHFPILFLKLLLSTFLRKPVLTSSFICHKGTLPRFIHINQRLNQKLMQVLRNGLRWGRGGNVRLLKRYKWFSHLDLISLHCIVVILYFTQ